MNSLIREQLIQIIKEHRNTETDKDIEEYVQEYGDRFYLYIKDDQLLGYADYFIVGKTLNIYKMV